MEKSISIEKLNKFNENKSLKGYVWFWSRVVQINEFKKEYFNVLKYDSKFFFYQLKR